MEWTLYDKTNERSFGNILQSIVLIYKQERNEFELFQHVTDGDKDTFRLGFRYMQVKYYIVSTPCAVSDRVVSLQKSVNQANGPSTKP